MNKLQDERLTTRITLSLSVLMLVLIEARMAMVLGDQAHSFFLTAKGKVNFVLFTLSMVLLASLLLIAWMRVKELAKNMKQRGADELSILLEKKNIYGNICVTFMVIWMCISSLADLIH